MKKYIPVVSVLLLFFLTGSDLSLVNAQSAKESETKPFSPSNSANYHRSQNERLVKQAIKQLYIAQAEYATYAGGGNYGMLNELYLNGLIDAALASGEKYGYNFIVETVNARAGQPPRFFITAKPRHYQRTGIHSFYMDDRCRIHADSSQDAEVDTDDPVVEVCEPFLAYQWEYDISFAVRNLVSAQRDYFNGAGKGKYGTLQELIDAGLVNQIISIPWDFWFLDMETTPASKGKPAGYKIWGTPHAYRITGIRSYFVDETEILRADDLQGDFADETTVPLLFENEELIKYAMRSLWNAQRHYPCLSGVKCLGYAKEFTLISKARLIDFIIENGEFGGYRFEMDVVDFPDEPWLNDFEIYATPINPNKKNRRSFYISKHSLLRGSDKNGNPADENDPYIEF